jgi:tripartite ATP-independent transporter DctP family solute receptor
LLIKNNKSHIKREEGKIMKKRFLAAVLAGTMMLSLVGCSGKSESGDNGQSSNTVKTTTLKLAFNQSENHPQYKALSEMSDALYEATNGAYEIEISPNELLGSQKDAFELVQNGTIQMAMVANSIVENVNSDFAVLGLPYAYDSTEHQKKVFTSGILDDIFASTTANKFNVLAAFTAGSRCVYTDKPITTPADLAGYKIRVMEAPTSIAMLNAMGGVATPMAQGEVYTAIQQGIINGGENNEITYADLKHYEVAPYFSYTRHLMIPDLLVINAETLSGMSEENQQILKDLCKEYTEREFELWDEQLDTAIETAKTGGATFTEVDITPFQEAVQPVINDVINKSESAKALYDEIRALAE